VSRRWTFLLPASLLCLGILARWFPLSAECEVAALEPAIQVTDPGDSGPGTLRWALETVGPGGVIVFDPLVFPPGSPATIQVQSALPPLDDGGVTLDATGVGVHLDGRLAPPGTVGLSIPSNGNLVQGLVIAGFDGPGVQICGANNRLEDSHVRDGGAEGMRVEGAGATGNLLLRNHIGVTPEGGAIGNASAGVLLRGGAHDNLVGLTRADANVIGASGADGVRLEGAGTRGNLVQGNFVGTDRLGRAGLGNQGCGVRLSSGAAENQVGGTGSGRGNIIGGNVEGGVCLDGAPGNTISGNHVGTALSGLTALPNGGPGIRLGGGANNNTLQANLISANEGEGILLGGAGTDANFILGNRIGVNAVGASALGNSGAGVLVEGGASANVIGRVGTGEENLISGNLGPGVWLRGEGTEQNVVAGNQIGTDVFGFQPLGNDEDGVRLSDDAQANLVFYNLISGNGANGLRLEGAGTDANLMAGNVVGMDLAGESPLPNGEHGIYLLDGASGNSIGESVGLASALAVHALWASWRDLPSIRSLDMGNLVAHNTGDGVRIEGMGTFGNALHHNRITANGGLGIRLVDGGNGDLAAPFVQEVAADQVTGQACAGCLVELFADPQDEGRTYLGAAQADASGNFTYQGEVRGPYLTATATDVQGNTSPFSRPMAVQGRVYLPLSLANR